MCRQRSSRLSTLRRKVIVCASLAIAIVAALVVYESGVGRDVVEAGTLNGPPLAPSGTMRAGRAVLMSANQMDASANFPCLPHHPTS